MATAEDSARSQGDDGPAECDLCAGTGSMTWQQPVPTPTGFVVHEMEHPCPRGCSGWWRMPAAEGRTAVDGHPRGGWAAEANRLGSRARREIEE